MRISTQQIYNSGVSNMQTGQTALAKTQEQISTGKNLNRPSDDPVAAAQILKLRREISAGETYADNIAVSQRRLEQEETVVAQVKDASDRIKELAIQGSNGTLTDQNRIGIADEIEQVQQFMLGLMNTTDVQGEYLFGGARGGIAPFDLDDFSYAGDNEVRFIQTGPAAQVQSTDTGRAVFQVVPGKVEMQLLNKPAGVEVSIQPSTVAGGVTDFQTYVEDNGKQDLTLVITGAVAADTVDPTTYPYQPATYTLTSAAGGSWTGAIDPLNTGAGLEVDLAELGLDLQLSPPATPVAFGTTPESTSTAIRPEQSKHSILTSAQTLIDALRTPLTSADSRSEVTAAMNEAMDEIMVAQDRMIQTQAQLGGRMVTLENQDAVNEDFKIQTEAALSGLEDLDYAEAISRFSFQEVALQAAQQTFSRVNQLSLFNYL
ncbi:MAG: flagellar hook-associated protein 3 FlgL [Motiliproteus sp.]|jgi:flagellar hook-associated protein 3 FlgL